MRIASYTDLTNSAAATARIVDSSHGPDRTFFTVVAEEFGFQFTVRNGKVERVSNLGDWRVSVPTRCRDAANATIKAFLSAR